MNKVYKSRKENPQKLTQLSPRSQPRHLVGKRTAQKDAIKDITSDSMLTINIQSSRTGLPVPCSSPAGVCSSSVGPHTKEQTHKTEMAQRRAARWTMNDWNRSTSVTFLQHQLNWQTLEQRRSVARLYLFYRIV